MRLIKKYNMLSIKDARRNIHEVLKRMNLKIDEKESNRNHTEIFAHNEDIRLKVEIFEEKENFHWFGMDSIPVVHLKIDFEGPNESFKSLEDLIRLYFLRGGG